MALPSRAGISSFGTRPILDLSVLDGQAAETADLTAELTALLGEELEVTADEGRIAGSGDCPTFASP